MVVTTAASAQSPSPPSRSPVASPTTQAGAPGPRVSGSLDHLVAVKLRLAYPLAASRVRNVPECRGLFERLGEDGVDRLAATVYYATPQRLEDSKCSTGSAAVTMVGSPETRLCAMFGNLATNWAAMLLLHEALHFAGLGEKPLDPTGMTSAGINEMVKARCRL